MRNLLKTLLDPVPEIPEFLASSLEKLAEQYERIVLNGGNRPSLTSPLAKLIGAKRDAAVDAFDYLLKIGALEPIKGRTREREHIVERYRVANAKRLDEALGRETTLTLTGRALKPILAIQTRRQEAEDFKNWASGSAESAWLAGKACHGFSLKKAKEFASLCTAAAALLGGVGKGLTIRRFSVSVVQDSKFVGLKQAGLQRLLSAYFGADPSEAPDFLDKYGVGRVAGPLTLAGPIMVSYKGRESVDLSNMPYAGVPPGGQITLHDGIRAVLTIENWECFHRHVTEAREDDVVVLYTAGFASSELLELLRALLLPGLSWYHWGDIDPYGLSIIKSMREALNHACEPHLMSLELLEHMGVAEERPSNKRLLEALAREDDWLGGLAAYFLSEGSMLWLEQERIDPLPVFRRA